MYVIKSVTFFNTRVGIPQNFHVAYIGMLYVEMSIFFFLLLSSLLIILLRGLGSSHLISTSYGKMEEENTLQSALFVLLKTGLLKSWAPGESCD